jgi:hypothetical protein
MFLKTCIVLNWNSQDLKWINNRRIFSGPVVIVFVKENGLTQEISK